MLWPFAFLFTLAIGQFISYYDYHKDNLPKLLSLGGESELNVLLPFNRTRIPGTAESEFIREFVINYFQDKLDFGWVIEQDSFQENGHNFTNLAFSTGDAERYIVFAAHYDSKIYPRGFIGAIDSAASCGILMYLAGFIDHIYTLERDLIDQTLSQNYVGVKIVFFDGEEALNEWGPLDSIYGAKHLASKWAGEDVLDTIDLLVLMDLIGSDEHVEIPSYFAESHLYYQMLSVLEEAYLKTRPHYTRSLDPANHKLLELGTLVIDDDHIPFYNAGIDVLHLIPFPFPTTWHTLNDDFNHLSQQEIYKWATLMTDFLVAFVELYN